MNSIVLESKEKLITELTKIINKKFTDKEFIKNLNQEFLKKGFSAKTVNLLLNREKFANELNDYQLVACCRACNINEKKYFGENIVKSYDSYIGEKREYNSVTFENMLKINEEEYIGRLSYKKIYELMSRNQLYYDLNFQRSPKIVKIGKEYVQIPNVDIEATKKIENAALNRKLESSMGVLGLILSENSDPKWNEKKNGEVYDLTVFDSPAILDFMHRLIGVTNAVLKNFSETGQCLDGYMILKFVIATPERCREIVYQSFLKSQTDVNYLKAIDNSNYNTFLEKIINNSKCLRNKVVKTFEETKMNSNILTYKSILIDALKSMDIEFDNMYTQRIKSKEMAENIDIIYELLCESSKFKNMPNLWVSILNESYLLCENKDNYDNMLMEYVDKILSITNDDIKELKINNKVFSIKSVINKFEVK